MSINFICIGQNRVIAIGDSRATHVAHVGAPPSISDNGPPKILQAGRYSVCGCVGAVFAGSLVIKDRLKVLASDSAMADSPRELLEALRDEIGQPLVENYSPDWISPGYHTCLTAFALTRHPSGEIDLLELRFPILDRDGQREHGEPEITLHMQGQPIFPPRLKNGRARQLSYCRPNTGIATLANHIDTDGDDSSILRSVDRVFECAAEQVPGFREAVGGRLDVASIDSTGFRFLGEAA